jgi:hypothetical protein
VRRVRADGRATPADAPRGPAPWRWAVVSYSGLVAALTHRWWAWRVPGLSETGAGLAYVAAWWATLGGALVAVRAARRAVRAGDVRFLQARLPLLVGATILGAMILLVAVGAALASLSR